MNEIKLPTLQCKSKSYKVKEKADEETTEYNVFLQNSDGVQLQIHTKDKRIHDSFVVGIDYTILAETPQTTLDSSSGEEAAAGAS